MTMGTADRLRALWRGDWLERPAWARRRHAAPFSAALPAAGLYAGLLALSAAGLVFGFLRADDPFQQELGINVGTDAFSILITVAIVHRFLERQERSRRLRGSLGGLRKAQRLLSAIVHEWAALLRTCAPPHADLPRHVERLFAPDTTERLIFSDADSREIMADRIDRIILAQQEIAGLLRQYTSSLDPAYVEVFDSLSDDAFPRLVRDSVGHSSQRAQRSHMNAARGARMTHFSRLLRAIDVQNECAREAQRLSAAVAEGTTGTLGLRIPPEQEIAVQTRIRMPRSPGV
jgi:hypothetical protein